MKTIAGFIISILIAAGTSAQDNNEKLNNKGAAKMDSNSVKFKEYQACENEGYKHLAEGDLYEAFNSFVKGLSINDSSVYCYYGMGRVLFEMEEYTIALSDFEKALLFNQDKEFEQELLLRIKSCKEKIGQN